MAAATLVLAYRLRITMLRAVLNGVELAAEYQYYGYMHGYHMRVVEPAGDITRAVAAHLNARS